MNQEILDCQKYLDPSKPVNVTSNDVKNYLKELGWEEGDKIPSGMPEYTSHVLVAMGKPVTIKSLEDMFKDETVIMTLKSALQKTKLIVNNKDTVEKRVDELMGDAQYNNDTGAELKKMAEIIAKKQLEKEAEMNVKDDDDGIEGLEEIGEDTVEKTEDSTEEYKNNNEVKEHVKLCPRCGLVLDVPYDPFPTTDEDRISYAYSLLGGTDFTKTYKVADGLLAITYKVPTAYIQRMIEDQLKYDTEKKRTLSYDQSYVNAVRYGLAASLVSVKALKGLDNNAVVPDIEDPRFETYGDTNILAFTKYIENNVIKSGTRESLFRSTYSDFVRLQAQLQHEMKAENFMQAVLDKS